MTHFGFPFSLSISLSLSLSLSACFYLFAVRVWLFLRANSPAGDAVLEPPAFRRGQLDARVPLGKHQRRRKNAHSPRTGRQFCFLCVATSAQSSFSFLCFWCNTAAPYGVRLFGGSKTTEGAVRGTVAAAIGERSAQVGNLSPPPAVEHLPQEKPQAQHLLRVSGEYPKSTQTHTPDTSTRKALRLSLQVLVSLSLFFSVCVCVCARARVWVYFLFG
jgi:hypothetical protein